MNKNELSSYSVSGLLEQYAKIMKELKDRGAVRTKNNPCADYAEWIVSTRMKMELAPNSKAGYDAKDNKGVKYQIKSRRMTPDNHSRQMGVIRNLDKKKFDSFIGVLFDEYFNVQEAYMVPHEVIGKYSRFSEHQNGHIFHLRGAVLSDSKIKDLTNLLQ